MSRIPPTTFRKLDRILRQLGFEAIPDRGKGSNVAYRHPDGRGTSVPNHPRDIGPNFITKVRRDIDLSRDDYLAMR